MNMSEEIVNWSKTTEYNLDKPELCNGPVTQYIYLSPTIALDNTLNAKVNTSKRVDLEFTDQNLLELSENIIEMSKQVAACLEM